MKSVIQEIQKHEADEQILMTRTDEQLEAVGKLGVPEPVGAARDRVLKREKDWYKLQIDKKKSALAKKRDESEHTRPSVSPFVHPRVCDAVLVVVRAHLSIKASHNLHCLSLLAA